jgi:hypothetical protein
LQKPDLLDHLVGAQGEPGGYFVADCLGGLQIDHQLKPCRLLNGKLAGIGAPEEPPADVLLIYAGGNATGVQLIPDSEYPPGLQSLPLANWKASIAANDARRGGSS